MLARRALGSPTLSSRQLATPERVTWEDDVTASNDAAQPQRAKPSGDAWAEAKRAISDRNDQARKAGKAERSAREQRESAARHRSERDGVYR